MHVDAADSSPRRMEAGRQGVAVDKGMNRRLALALPELSEDVDFVPSLL